MVPMGGVEPACSSQAWPSVAVWPAHCQVAASHPVVQLFMGVCVFPGIDCFCHVKKKVAGRVIDHLRAMPTTQNNNYGFDGYLCAPHGVATTFAGHCFKTHPHGLASTIDWK